MILEHIPLKASPSKQLGFVGSVISELHENYMFPTIHTENS